METLQNDSPDTGLADAAEALQSQLPGGGEQDLGQQAPPPAPTSTRPTREALHGQWRQERKENFRGRMNRERQAHSARAEMERRYQEQLASNAKTMQAVSKLLQDKFPEEAQKIDLFGEGAADQLAALLQGRTEAALKPIAEWVAAKQQEEAQQRQQAQQQAEHAQVQKDLEADLREEAAEYAATSPYAHGAEQRLQSWLDLKTRGNMRLGMSKAQAQQLAGIEIFQRGEWARSQGWNGIEAIDDFVCGEFEAMGLVPVDPEDDLEAVWNGNSQQAPPPPPATEAGRLSRVQQRTRGAATTSPRAPERVSQEKGDLETLVAGGETDMRRLQDAALRDANGDGAQAAILLSRAFSMQLQW